MFGSPFNLSDLPGFYIAKEMRKANYLWQSVNVENREIATPSLRTSP